MRFVMEMEAPAGLGADSTNDTHVKRIPWLLCGEHAVKRGRETNQHSGSQRGGNFVPQPAFGMSRHISGCRHWGGGFLACSCQTPNSAQDTPSPRTMTKNYPAQSTSSAATRSPEAAPRMVAQRPERQGKGSPWMHSEGRAPEVPHVVGKQ